ncbi:Macrophage colony-stimulating factor 1 receptor [Purpureocillium takamizusanense]|uniref:Macrophage colony-stimulating factor 1 receptor n=1 Tax=Purpureocillium takamizusanense TaxID=2060973 RepID=A0A9Q8QP32_9HYPO|nr:Macrophage colony-stimulating factor 1 receptor [Purpureocillium takamizusanense]UNI21967.1 Macrophage colony-stimulating factor 1 receptor [Purpureocillium takamizusanense]
MSRSDHVMEVRADSPGFSFTFLIYCIVSGLLAIFFLLYFNRLFGSIASYAIRAYTWHKYRAYIDISALQISLLAGRIFFTGLRYHGSNETFLVQYGDITWRYWLRRVREADIRSTRNTGEGVTADKNAGLPCRINVKLVGVEWFVYNRSPAYDTILEGLADIGPPKARSSDLSDANEKSGLRPRSKPHNGMVDAADLPQRPNKGPKQPHPDLARSIAESGSINSDAREDNAELPFLLQLFPIQVECQKPALVLGNDNAKAILIVKASSASAIVDASKTQTCDQYRQDFNIRFNHPVVELRENDEFKEDQVSRATRQRHGNPDSVPTPSRSLFRHHRRKVVHSLRNLVPYWRRSVESFSTDSRGAEAATASQVPGSSHWQGLSRYLDDQDQDDKARWASVEYAAVSTIIDSPEATLRIYWDAVSKVTTQEALTTLPPASNNVNGSEPPAWGMNLSINGGTVNYGPWADRQRAELQRVFFPTLAKDTTPAKALSAGAWRVATQFKLSVDIENAVTLRIPIREESKNWRWRGKEPPIRHQGGPYKRKQRSKAKSSKGDGTHSRPSGWLEVKVPDDTTVSYSMDMLASALGYSNHLSIDLPSTELWSSVNHDLLWTSGPQKISCDLSNPLPWNTLRNWQFTVDSDDTKLYLLRDHIFLLIDLVDDWGSGPLVEYLVFTPYKYHLNLNLRNVELYLNVNDENIIDKPTSLDDNAFLILSSPLLHTELTIPLDKFRPSKNSIPFDIRADSFDLALHTSQSSTHTAFLSSNEIGHGEGLAVTGSYQYNATTSPINTDTLILNVHGQSPYAYLYGFVIRYFILLKDNYFGDHVHFKTLDEYQEQLQAATTKQLHDPPAGPPNKKSNDLDVILAIKVDDPRIMIPVNLYCADRFVQCELVSLCVDLRFTNYYMDMELELSPLSLSIGLPGTSQESPGLAYSNTQLFIDGLRVFGHRTFGLPPSEPTYLCNWDVSVGAVGGECTGEFLASLAKGGAAFGFMFDDVENALVPYSSLVFHDITFVRVDVSSCHLWVRVEEAAFLLSTDAIRVNSNDWAGSHYSKRANISIPNIELSCVNAESAARHYSRRQHPVETAAYLRTDVRLSTIGRKFHFSEERKIQQDLVRREDQRTGRTPFLLLDEFGNDFVPEVVDPPAQCAPPPPYPATDVMDEDASYRSASSSHRSNRLRHQSSFLSSSSSSTNSVRKALRPVGGQISAKQKDLSSRHDLYPVAYTQRKTSGSSGGRPFITPARDKDVHDHSSVAFSSQYFAPHFPLEDIRADVRDATFAPLEEEQEDFEDIFERAAAKLDDIDPRNLSEEHVHSSALIEFPRGITAFFTPEAVRHATSLLVALQPTEPDDILDSLQVESISEIFTSKKQEHVRGKMQDILVRLPQANLRFLNSSTLDSPDELQEAQDQYDIRLSRVALVTRTVTEAGGSKPPRTSLHFRLQSAKLSASERLSSLQAPQAAVMVQVDTVMFSLGAKDVTYFDADIGSIVGSTATGKIEYLAALIHRTGSIASDLERLLRETTSRQDDRTKYLVHALLQDGKSVNDPSFLIRPSAVLRSAHRHIRTVDSWKLIMRLRHIWETAGDGLRSRLLQNCTDNSSSLPADAAESVISAFQRWRSWDLDDVASSVLMMKMFGKMKGTQQAASFQEYPLLGACRLTETRFVLDPGPKQNSISFLDISVRIDKKPSDAANNLPEVPGFDGPLMVVDLCCGDAAIHMNWELCELADDILRLYNRAQKQEREKKRPTRPHVEESIKPPSAVQVVVEIVQGSVDVEMVNLTSKTLSSGIKASVLMYNTEDQAKFASVMVNCNAVTSRLHSHSQFLGMYQLRQPSIFFAHEAEETEETTIHAIKATASNQGFSLEVKQDPLVLLEVFDLLVKDEVAQLYRLKKQVPVSPTTTAEPVNIADRLSKVKINIAMFLDGYTITIPLLQSLTYKITGVVARASCATNYGQDLIFDFDVKENSHETQINVKNKPQSISLLQIPPTNGRITSRTSGLQRAVTVLSSVEVIQLDASAVHSLLTALNRPQISSAIEDAQEQLTVIRGHMSDIFGSSAPPTPTDIQKPGTSLAYNVHLTLAGLRIFAKTALKSNIEPTAQILFSLEKVYLQVCNQQDPNGPALKYPDLHVNLRQISLDILRGRQDAMRSCGRVGASVTVSASSRRSADGREDWHLNFRSDDLDISLSPETVSTVIDVIGYMGSKIKDLDTSRELEYLRKLRQSKPRITINDDEVTVADADILDSVLASVVYHFELRNIRVSWDVADESQDHDTSKEDLVLSIKLIEFGTRTRKSARLTIANFQLQTVPPGQDKNLRSLHSALLPEVIFNVAYVSTPEARRMAFQATGESLDLRLTSGFIVPAANLVESISLSTKNVRKASAQWATAAATANKKPDEPPVVQRQRSLFGKKRLESLLVDADFAGAVVYVASGSSRSGGPTAKYGQPSLAGKYGQFNADDSGSGAVLRSPGLAWKCEYRDNGKEDPSLYGEVKIDASSNILYPSVVPLVLDILASVKKVVSDDTRQDKQQQTSQPPKLKAERSADEDNILTADPSAVLGRLRLNLGLRICRQEFSLSCQPIARVAATTGFDNVYFTVNTVTSQEQGNFFAISGVLTRPMASVQHVYSRESTAGFEVDAVTLSSMNSKHVSGTSGVSAILKVSPMKISANAKQAQDFLLFREIWYPRDLRRASTAPVARLQTETSQGHLVQRYQQVAATAAFPWTATISIEALDVSVDLGQAIGKSVFQISDFWVSSKKTSDWEQNLCLGFKSIGVDCTGRLSGFVALQHFRMRSSIQWPKREEALNETPLVQASLAFNALRVKAAFDYQAFLVADVTSLELLMYNVRERRHGRGDRLVAIFDGDAVQVFGTATSAAQGLALWQAIQKLIQERRENLESSLRDIEKFMRRTSSTSRNVPQSSPPIPKLPEDDTMAKSPISLDTDVVVTLKALNLGVFPSTFSDHQVFKMEAFDAYARFAASVEHRRIHSILRMTLGQLRIGLAGVRNVEAPKTLSEMTVEDVVSKATGSRGGTILKVPRVEAVMETWQAPNSNHIEYIFKSAFEGKVEVGWNYSRVSYIRGMWANHCKSLEQTWGRQLPMTAVKITGVPETEGEGDQKITAEVNVPQSKYDYRALEPPIIETPQLRDMGEATPPLEWIGLHREKLPNLTHQIVIVSLLELAGEVEDAYSRILGSS